MPKIRRQFWSSALLFAAAIAPFIVPFPERSETQSLSRIPSRKACTNSHKPQSSVDCFSMEGRPMLRAGASCTMFVRIQQAPAHLA